MIMVVARQGEFVLNGLAARRIIGDRHWRRQVDRTGGAIRGWAGCPPPCKLARFSGVLSSTP